MNLFVLLFLYLFYHVLTFWAEPEIAIYLFHLYYNYLNHTYRCAQLLEYRARPFLHQNYDDRLEALMNLSWPL